MQVVTELYRVIHTHLDLCFTFYCSCLIFFSIIYCVILFVILYLWSYAIPWILCPRRYPSYCGSNVWPRSTLPELELGMPWCLNWICNVCFSDIRGYRFLCLLSVFFPWGFHEQSWRYWLCRSQFVFHVVLCLCMK